MKEKDKLTRPECFFRGLLVGLAIGGLPAIKIARIEDQKAIERGFLMHSGRVYKIIPAQITEKPDAHIRGGK